jgi:predicted transcriptional regulator
MNPVKTMTGRRCYDHLGGKLGAALFQFLLDNEWIRLEEDKRTVYIVTEKGEKGFEALGLKL